MNSAIPSAPRRAPTNYTDFARVASSTLMMIAYALLVFSVVYSLITGNAPIKWCFYGGMALILIHRVPTMLARAFCRHGKQKPTSEMM